MSDVFISYARSSAPQAHKVAEALRALGYEVWLDDQLPAHRAYADVIEERVREAKAVVVIWSAEATKSEWVRSEASIARAAHSLVQLTLDKSPLPMPFDQIQCADLRGWTGEPEAPGWRKVVASVADLVGAAASAPVAAAGATQDSTAAARQGSSAGLPGSGRTIAERKTVTVLFADIKDWLDRQGELDPEDALALTDPAVRLMTEAVLRHDGHISRTTGDGVLAVFGAPLAREDDPQQAVYAALELRDDLKRHWAGLHLAGEPLEVRVGVSTGEVVVQGASAADGRGDYVSSGPVISLASRLQALAPPDSVVIGPATERLVQGSFELEDLGSHALKGISDAMTVWRVLSRTDAGSFDIRAGRGLTPMVGRGAELEMLRQRWEQSCDGEMRCVLLVGEPGIGKSRTLRAFRDSIDDLDHQTVSFQCSPYYRDSAFWPVLQLLQRSFGLDPDADAGQLETALAGFTVDMSETVLVLSNLLELQATDRYPKIDTSQISFNRRCLSVLVDLVADMARRQPVLLVMEDAHWIDPSTLGLVRSLLERLTASRLLVVITARPEFKPDWRYPQVVQLSLDRMSRRDRFEMIDRLTGGKPMPEVVLDQIVAKTDGVPLFVEELTKTVLQGDLLRDAGDRYELNGPLQTIAIPDTLQGSLLSRLDRLEPEIKEVAQIASTIGREFQQSLLALIASKPEAELLETLDRLVAADIILPAPDSAPDRAAFVFPHALIQDVAYQSMLVTRRRHLHGEIAVALESRYPEIVERQPELVAQNFAASEQPERAVEYWRQAGDRALARAGCEEAIAHANAGLRLAEGLSLGDHDRAALTLPLLIIRGKAEHRLALRQAIDTFRQAAKIAQAQGFSSYLAQAALNFEYAVSYLDESPGAAVPMLQQALAEIGPEETIDRCRLLSRLAAVLHRSGSFERAGEITGQAVILAQRLGDGEGLFDALTCELISVGGRPITTTEFAKRRQVLEDLVKVAKEVADPDNLGHAYCRALCGYLEIGDRQSFQTALEDLRRGTVTRGQVVVHEWIAINAEAVGSILDGDFAQAERQAEEAQKLAESVEAKLSSGIYGMQMFTIRREQGRLAEVAPVIKRLVDENPEDSTWRPGLMLIASDLGFEGPALTNLERMAETGFSVPVDSKRLATWTYIAEVAARLKTDPYTEQVYEHLLPFRDQAVTVPAATICLGSTARYLGLLATALGDWSAAEAHFEYALGMNERMSAWPWLAHTRHEYGLMLSARNRKGDQKRAADLIARGAATARELNMFSLVERIGGTMTHTGATG